MVKFENGNIRISVRNLVEFILRSGDIDNRYGGRREKDAMRLGSRIHRKIQGRMGSDYAAEVPLKIKREYGEFYISVEGRADGIITPSNSGGDEPDVIIDEIKSMYADVSKITEPSQVHRAQAMCYGYMYGSLHDLSLVGIRLTYVNIESEETLSDEDIHCFNETYTIEQLTEWFNDIISKYYTWAKISYDHMKLRNESAKKLEFPFEYREGQKNIAVNVYKAIRLGTELYIQAPTGVGKTMSVIFPAVKSMGEKLSDKIFYLTAKTITGTVALNAYEILREKGLVIKTITLTAKEKLCMLDEPECNPIKCTRAKGHFDRVNEAVFKMISNEENITRDIIIRYADEYNVCPFEMSLDASYFADSVICDYNYAFDPNAKLKRYFAEDGKKDYVFLVDESHNLVDRAREMYSAVLCKEDFLQAKRLIGTRDKRVSSALERCNKNLLEKKRECGDKMYFLTDDISDFLIQCERAYSGLEKILEVYREFEGREKVLQLYFDMGNFFSIYDVADEGYKMAYQIGEDGNFYIRLMCINPAANLRACMEQVRGTVMYSATLLPVNYYKLLLGGKTDAYAVYIDSPFKKENRLIAIGKDVSTKYTARGQRQYERVSDYIYGITSVREGNYMIFFPSYRYMESVAGIFQEKYGENKMEIIMQASRMSESERELFLEKFQEKRKGTLVAFCIMGGIFSEGIDLTHEQLIGTVVVGTGFPQVCMDREIIKNYFDEKGMNGFDFAYRYPGMNKVLQAAGRVIRTVSDRGVIVLLDDRFLSPDYRGLFPREWEDKKKADIGNIERLVEEFWGSF